MSFNFDLTAFKFYALR